MFNRKKTRQVLLYPALSTEAKSAYNKTHEFGGQVLFGCQDRHVKVGGNTLETGNVCSDIKY